MRRTDARGEGRWQELSWNDAYAIIAESLSRLSDEHGPEVIATITGCYHKENAVTATFMFSNLLGTPNVLDANHLCIIPDVIAQLVTVGEVIHSDLPVDYKGSNCLLIWGANPVETRPPQAMDIFRTRRRGGGLIVVDPRPTATASRADIWLRVRPGADAALALAMLHVIINDKPYDEQFAPPRDDLRSYQGLQVRSQAGRNRPSSDQETHLRIPLENCRSQVHASVERPVRCHSQPYSTLASQVAHHVE